MAHRFLPKLLLASQIACVGWPAAAQSAMLELTFQGGSEDDVAYARVATGLELGSPLDAQGFQTALAAIRRTDRFRWVEGGLEPGPMGVRAWVRLDPWPAVEHLAWRGDAKRAVVQKQIRGLRTGMRPGDFRLATWSQELQTRLVEAGYPAARVTWSREQADRTLAITVALGPGSLVQRVEVTGNPAPYTAADLLRYSKLQPGHSLWTPALQLETARNLNKVLHAHHRYEAQVDLDWDGRGTLRLGVVSGPRVQLVAEGDGLGWTTSLSDLVPLTRTERYSPELLDEGDRRIIRFLRNQGYLDAQVGHRREVVRNDPGGYQEVKLTYSIHKGERSHLDRVVFQGNQAMATADLERAAALPGRFLGLGAPLATPVLLDALEDRVKAFYLARGYPDTTLRRELSRREGRNELHFTIQEGPQRLLKWLRLELPPGGFGAPWTLGECLPLILSERPVRVGGGEETRVYHSDRREMETVAGTLTSAGEAGGPVVFTLTLSQPIPLLKGDLTRVYTALKQQRLPALGVVRAVVRLNLEAIPATGSGATGSQAAGGDGGTGVRIQVPAQPLEQVQRLVVTGSDKTRARAVLRETQLRPGAPMDTDQLTRAQARLSYLGAFQRVDLRSLAEERGGQPEAPVALPMTAEVDDQLAAAKQTPAGPKAPASGSGPSPANPAADASASPSANGAAKSPADTSASPSADGAAKSPADTSASPSADGAAKPPADASASPSADGPAKPPADASAKPSVGTPARAGAPAPWKEGDLLLGLEERPSYVVTNSFGYDRSQGYYVGFGVQQLNVGGMGRTIDYNIRAGNGTIQNPTLARLFPTGTYNRSVDSFSVGYTDPWFDLGPLRNWLPDRTQYHTEAAYIQEQQALYLIHRRRVLNSLQWSLTPQVSFQLGHRWERVDVASAIVGISTDELAIVARYPTHAIISAPFAQLARDTRDNAFDPTRGTYSAARVEFANQLFLTSANSSFVKVDLKHQWTWPVGYRAKDGVVALGLHLGIAKPTASSASNLPLSERFFAGGPFSFRGVEPDALGVQTPIPLRYTTGSQAGQEELDGNGQPITYKTPVGGQALALINLEYRFPLVRPSVWGEVFVDSGQVYESISRQPAQPGVDGAASTPATGYPPFRTALGLGLIFKIGIPLKIEYAQDVSRILGRPRSQDDVDTQLKSVLISAGFQF